MLYDLCSVNNRHIPNNMAHIHSKNWVTFDEDHNKIQQSKPLTNLNMENQQPSQSFPLSTSFMSSSDSESRRTSPTNISVDNSKYLQVKELRKVTLDQKDNQHLEPFPVPTSTSDCKYSAFSSLRMSEDKRIYLGWSKNVLGVGAMGWSEHIMAKHSLWYHRLVHVKWYLKMKYMLELRKGLNKKYIYL